MTRRFPCSRCGLKRTADQMVFSRFTRKHYCSALGDCERRAKRLSRKTALGMGVKVW